ncbi:MAG TPA: hypothetical protein HA279_00925, partial [Candidatus Poseidoniaceae archaeon]|nr:hypothetical protein [Candidatus Poseidoniaceae archaeon]
MTSENFPRSSDFSEISIALTLLSEFDELYHDDIGRNSVQGLNHVLQTSKILSLLDDSDKPTRSSKNFYKLDESEKMSLISLGVEKSKVVQQWMKWCKVDSIFGIDLDSAKSYLSAMDKTITKNTISGRSSTLKSLLKQAMEHHPSVSRDSEALLWPLSYLKRDDSLESQNIFEDGKAEMIIENLASNAEFIRVATGFFSIGGYESIAKSVSGAHIRIIVGDRDERGRNILYDPATKFRESVEFGSNNLRKRNSLEKLYKEMLFGTTRVSSAHARQHSGFHAKVYIFDRSAVLQGSMNTSITGFRYNIENGDVKTAMEDVEFYITKYDQYYTEAKPIEASLIEIIQESWALDDVSEISPYLAYLRILLELYGQKEDFEDNLPYTLDDYQRYTANKASRDIMDNGGSLLVAPTGTGKSVMGSYVALNLFTNRKINRVVIVCPGHLRPAWERYMLQFGLSATMKNLSFFRKQKGTDEERDFFAKHLTQNDLVIVDECHGIKNEISQGAINLLKAIGEPGKGGPKRLLMTATPYSKGIEDLNALLSYVHPTSVARKAMDVASLPGVAYLTHPLIAKEFAKLVDGHRAVTFDKYMYFPVKVTRRKLYPSDHAQLFSIIENLDLRTKQEIDLDLGQETLFDLDVPTFKPGRTNEIIKWTLAKIAESSPPALMGFVQNQLASNLESTYLEHEKLIADYTEILDLTMKKPNDSKLDLLVEELQYFVERGQKVLIFTSYLKTVEYLHNRLSTFFPEANVESLTGDVKEKNKLEMLRRFAPVAHGQSARRRKSDIDIFIATDCISEGQNLQDATLLVNCDLTWTPLKLIQRVGRLDRPTPEKRTFGVWNFFPGQDYFERSIRIHQRLNRRGADYRAMSGIDVIHDNIRDLDNLDDESVKHVERIYSKDDIDFDQLLSEFIPATDYLRVLAAS